MAKKLYIAGYQDSTKEVHSDENVYFEPSESVLAQFSMKERDAIWKVMPERFWKNLNKKGVFTDAQFIKLLNDTTE